MTRQIDVLIIGAGPTGIAAACELLRQGITNILICDVLSEPLIQTKGSLINPRTLEVLSNFENVVSDLQKRGHVLNKIRNYSAPGQLIGQVEMEGKVHSSHQFISCEQWYTEKCLNSYIESRGISVLRSTKVTEIVYNQEGYPISELETAKDGKVERIQIKSQFVIAADGAKSTVRKQLNIPFIGEVLKTGFVACHFTAKKPAEALNPLALTLYLFKQGFAFSAPMPENSWIVAVDLTAEQDKFVSDKVDAHGLAILKEYPQDAMEKLLQERLGPGIEIEKMIWNSHFRVNQRLAAAYSDNKRVYLAGDACHSHTPLGGQGLNFGIQDAVNLGWKMSLVIKEQCYHDLLLTYQKERRNLGNLLVEGTTRLQKAASNRSPIVYHLRNNAFPILTAFPYFVEVVANTIGDTIFSYDSSLSQEHWRKPFVFPYLFMRRRQNILRLLTKRIKAGDKCRLEMMQTVHDKFLSSTAGFKLLIFEGIDGNTPLTSKKSYEKCQEFGETAKSISKGLVTDYFVVKKDAVEDYKNFGVLGQCFLMIRPDGYIGMRCEPLELDMLRGYLVNCVKSAKVKGPPLYTPIVGDWVLYIVIGVVGSISVLTIKHLWK
ncbi:hypothetical protein HDV01_007667 [Terramyces sp. JEL0728]|nr:hypothetical protein HDV01_007667 [Terramyces sp. JEL0728]